MQPNSIREAAMFVWESFLNVPYKWGGDDPLDGVDCSGLVIEGLKSVGVLPREGDWTADGLLNSAFKDSSRLIATPPYTNITRGMLAFWGTPVRHVEIVWAVFQDRILTIGASGGGSKTVDRAEAIRSNAYVKIRRITPNWVAIIDPFAG